MFQESFWCAEALTLVPDIKWSICSCVLLFNALRGRGFGLISIRLLRLRYCLLLFYLQFCVWLFLLFIRSLHKLDGNCMQLVVLVAIGTAHPWGVWSVWVVVLIHLVFVSLHSCGYFCCCWGSFHRSIQFVMLVAMVIAAIVVLWNLSMFFTVYVTTSY